MEKCLLRGPAFFVHMLVLRFPLNLWVTLRVSAAPAAVSRPERSDRVREKAQYPPLPQTATGRAYVTYCSVLKPLPSLPIHHSDR